MASIPPITVCAAFYGLDWIATVPPTVALTAKIFGRERVGLMFGWIMPRIRSARRWPPGALAGSVTNEGAYDHAFLLSGGLCVLTAGAVLFIGRGSASRAMPTDAREPEAASSAAS